MTETLLNLKDFYWQHREVMRLAAVAASGAAMQLVILIWTLRRLQELGHIRERMSRLADGLALLTDTTEAGLSTLVRQVEQMNHAHKKQSAPARRPVNRATAKRVASAARNGQGVNQIVAREAMSESEVRLHMTLANANGREPQPRQAPNQF